jgi:hypothetical protein
LRDALVGAAPSPEADGGVSRNFVLRRSLRASPSESSLSVLAGMPPFWRLPNG